MKYNWWSYTRIIIHGTGVGSLTAVLYLSSFLHFIFSCWNWFLIVLFWGHTWWCSGLTFGSMLRYHSWQGLGDWAQVVWVQDDYPKCYIIFLALILCFYRFLYHYFCLSSGSTKHISMDSFCLYRAIITSSEIFFQKKFIWFLVLETQPVVLKSHSCICT